MDITPHPASPASGVLSSHATARFGIDAEILLGGEAAPMTVMAMTVQPDQGAPAHISFEEDKVFCISEGRLLFLIGAQKIEVKAEIGSSLRRASPMAFPRWEAWRA